MITRPTITALKLTVVVLAAGLATAAPASAGGVGDFLSPAFGTSCVNHNTEARAQGATAQGIGAASSNLAGLPIGTPLNQCGGADAPVGVPGTWVDPAADGPWEVTRPIFGEVNSRRVVTGFESRIVATYAEADALVREQNPLTGRPIGGGIRRVPGA